MTTGRINQVSYRDCELITAVTNSRTPTEVVFTWDTHEALQLHALYCPSFKLTSLKQDQKQVPRLTWTVPGTKQEDELPSLPVYWLAKTNNNFCDKSNCNTWVFSGHHFRDRTKSRLVSPWLCLNES